MLKFAKSVLVTITFSAVIAMSCGAVFADASQLKKVSLKDGRTLVGEVRPGEDGLTLDIVTDMGVIKVSKNNVKSIVEAKEPVAEYKEKRGDVKSGDYKGLYKVARWGWDEYRKEKEVLKLAAEDLKAALEIKPGYERAELLLSQIEGTLKKKKTPAIKRTVDRGGNKTVSGEAMPTDNALVSQDDIYWIRLKELRPSDRVSVTFKNNVIARYIDEMKGSIDGGWDRIGADGRFRALPNYAKVIQMLRYKGDDVSLMKDIQITRNPRFMIDFRSRIWPMVRTYCANINCHGGPEPRGGLQLFVLPNNINADYTNFVILSGTTFNRKYMIDRSEPERSLLLQYLLNPKVAADVHPKVRGANINYAIPNVKAGTYKRIIDWIRSLASPAPNYHLKWTPPKGMKVNCSGLVMLPVPAPSQDDLEKEKEEKTPEEGTR